MLLVGVSGRSGPDSVRGLLFDLSEGQCTGIYTENGLITSWQDWLNHRHDYSLFRNIKMKKYLVLVLVLLCEVITSSIANAADINYSFPIYTQRFAIVCPLSILEDNREGHDIAAANDAMLTVFGRTEAIEKVGCEEWHGGIRVYVPEKEIPKKDKYVHWIATYQSNDFSDVPRLIPDAYLTNGKHPHKIPGELNPEDKRKLQAQKAVGEFARSKGITVEQLDYKIGMKHEDFVLWLTSVIKYTGQPGMPDLFELIERSSGYTSPSTESDTNRNEYQTPERIAVQNNEPEFETTSIEIYKAYQENALSADAKFRGHRFKVKGKLKVSFSEISSRGSPPRISLFFGMFQGSTSRNSFASVVIRSKTKYWLTDSENTKFANLKRGNIVILICTGVGRDATGMAQLADCSFNVKQRDRVVVQ